MVTPNRIRARIVGRPVSLVTRRGKRSPYRSSWMHWYMTVTDGKKIIYADDCRDLSKMHDAATAYVAAFRGLAGLGYKFRAWSELVDEARI